MKIDYSDLNIDQKTKDKISSLIKLIDPDKDDLESMWELLDMAWDEHNCSNRTPDWNNINKFYSDPVWILNGLFIEQDALSMAHRHIISDWVIHSPSANKILDYGGGFGTLAKLIADKKPSLCIDIYEPYPSAWAEQKISEYPQIQFVRNIKDKYDIIISTDVLEHVHDPLKIFADMITSVKINGYLIIANNFLPVIKCHLPQTFHLKYTFNMFAKLMGLEVVQQLKGSHATIFLKKFDKTSNWRLIRLLENLSKAMFSIVEFSKPIYRLIKHENTSY